MYTALLFDLDGTLTDSKEGIVRCFEHALAEVGVASPGAEALQSRIGEPMKAVFAELLGPARQHQVELAVEHYRARFVRDGMFESRVYPGIQQALRTLRIGRRRMWVVSSKQQQYATKVLAHFGLTTFFDGIYGSDLDGLRSDKLGVVKYMMGREQLDARITVVIGDRKHDVLAGKQIGTGTIGVLWGYGSRQELTEAGADSVVSDADGLVAALR